MTKITKIIIKDGFQVKFSTNKKSKQIKISDALPAEILGTIEQLKPTMFQVACIEESISQFHSVEYIDFDLKRDDAGEVQKDLAKFKFKLKSSKGDYVSKKMSIVLFDDTIIDSLISILDEIENQLFDLLVKIGEIDEEFE